MAEAEIEIPHDADTAYGHLCDVRSVPQWVRGVARVDVIETDEQGRATLARFISMPARASVSYTLRYRYEDHERRVEWHSEERTERALQGRAQVVPLSEDRCRLRYELDVWNAASIPMWARAALKEDAPQAVVQAFRRWLERSH